MIDKFFRLGNKAADDKTEMHEKLWEQRGKMVITNDKLEKFISGAVRFENSDGYLFPKRFTKAQSERLADNDFCINAVKRLPAWCLDFELIL